jgi:hypothetical protein
VNLPFGDFDEGFFKSLIKLDYLIGSDVFFDSKCKFLEFFC